MWSSINRFCSNLTKFLYVSIPYLFSYLIQDPSLCLIAVNSSSCMQQILVNSFYFYSITNFFWFSLLWHLRYTPSVKSRHLISKYMGFFLSIYDINFSFKCFLLCNHTLCFFSLLILLRCSMAKSKISLSKCHTRLEKMWFILKYLLILTTNITS